MVQGKWYGPGQAEPVVYEIREKVFGRGQDELDAASWNVAVRYEGEPAAVGRISWRDGAYVLDGIGVMEHLRHRGVGDLILRLLLFKAESHAASRVVLTCPADLVPFFARLGFMADETTEGVTKMSLPGDRILLSCCHQ